MDCGHTFCSDCWRQHCLTQIADGRTRKLLCMGIKCNAVCDEDKVQHSTQCCKHILLAIKRLQTLFNKHLRDMHAMLSDRCQGHVA